MSGEELHRKDRTFSPMYKPQQLDARHVEAHLGVAYTIILGGMWGHNMVVFIPTNYKLQLASWILLLTLPQL